MAVLRFDRSATRRRRPLSTPDRRRLLASSRQRVHTTGQTLADTTTRIKASLDLLVRTRPDAVAVLAQVVARFVEPLPATLRERHLAHAKRR